ncbi:hypothetical protein FSP39_013577 [Pinctada imbricata]|uniref:CCHC-type domain-containing protein n=1 Tax=Pinctada imbricata TaxID=66713 RepID=A0AA89BUM9_PINIB|nr:hypothetical protein FSP39_013577 [Pinctada imbricata]
MESEPTPRVSLEDILERVEKQGENLQKELSELKIEVRGSAHAVKKLKSESQIKWKYEGNKVQHQFNSDLLEDVDQITWALQNSKYHYAEELNSTLREKLSKRNKLIKIADSSEAGWETVRQYETNPVASDSEDENKIFKAETRAIRKRKSKTKPIPKKSRSNAETNAPAHNFRFPSSQPIPAQPFLAPHAWLTGAPAYQSSIGQQYGDPSQFTRQRGACFSCGSHSHWRNQCPFNSKSTSTKSKAE